MSGQYTLICKTFQYWGIEISHGEFLGNAMNVPKTLGKFDSYEDALWRQMELQEEYIQLIQDIFAGHSFKILIRDAVDFVRYHPRELIGPDLHFCLNYYPLLTHYDYKILPPAFV